MNASWDPTHFRELEALPGEETWIYTCSLYAFILTYIEMSVALTKEEFH
jgi:hypothetical protein